MPSRTTRGKPSRPAVRSANAATPPETAAGARRRWLLLVHQLPANPSNLRVRTWRRLQQLGALPVKQAVYVLPDSPAAREDFEWLRAEIKGSGGDASVFAADHVDAWSDDALVEEFRRSRRDAYLALARDVERAPPRTARRRRTGGTRAPASRRMLEGFRQRLAAIDAVDFFGSAGRDEVAARLDALEGRLSGARRPEGASGAPGTAPHTYRNRLWVTRPRPGVDRMASAWLIRRFIDPQARFGFAADAEAVPARGVPFDMFGVELSHRGTGCTFETLCAVFGLHEPAVARIAGIVHDLDLKDAQFGAPERETVGSLIDGLQLAEADDQQLLEQGISLFEGLYRSFERSGRPASPRPRPSARTRAPRSRR